MPEIDLEIFSPVHRLQHPLFDDTGLKVFIKRDDLIHPIISGNKWRKLKYLLRRARNEGKTHLVTFGGAYSNHLLATAAAAAIFGFSSTGFVRGDTVDNDVLFLCRLHGMELIFINRDQYRDKRSIFGHYYANRQDTFFIDEAGASPEAVEGCSEIIGELKENYDHIFCACGTGATVAGILQGSAAQTLPVVIEAVSVLKNGAFLKENIAQLSKPHTNFNLHTDYHFGGYGKVTSQLAAFVAAFISITGVMIEPVYTGKMFYALFDLAAKGYFKKGSRILTIHTGGIWGITGTRKHFNLF